VDLLDRSIERGATVLAIGPYTNLALLEQARPGRLDQVPVVIMGGWVRPPENGLPQWGPEEDWNVQCDTQAALAVSGVSRLTMVTLPATLGVRLRAADLPRLAHSGPIGELLAHQSRAHGAEHDMSALGRAHPAIPDDLLNFQFDPVACAVALGWQGAEIEMVKIEPVFRGEVLRFRVAGKGHTRLVVAVDGDAFNETWLTAVEMAEHRR
jgi:inosine-uridine nucleoside N-ribohydrolase